MRWPERRARTGTATDELGRNGSGSVCSEPNGLRCTKHLDLPLLDVSNVDVDVDVLVVAAGLLKPPKKACVSVLLLVS